MDEEQDVARHFSTGQLKTLFELNTDVPSDTHEKLKCQRCLRGREIADPPPDSDTNSDLANWFHAQKDAKKIPDQVLRRLFTPQLISFVFYQKSHEQTRLTAEQKEEKENEDYNPRAEEDSENE